MDNPWVSLWILAHEQSEWGSKRKSWFPSVGVITVFGCKWVPILWGQSLRVVYTHWSQSLWLKEVQGLWNKLTKLSAYLFSDVNESFWASNVSASCTFKFHCTTETVSKENLDHSRHSETESLITDNSDTQKNGRMFLKTWRSAVISSYCSYSLQLDWVYSWFVVCVGSHFFISPSASFLYYFFLVFSEEFSLPLTFPPPCNSFQSSKCN